MVVSTEQELGRLLRAERLARDLGQRDLAELAGVGLSALRRLEAGQGSTLRTAMAVLAALGLTVEVDASEERAVRRRATGLPTVPRGLERREERVSWQLHRAVAAKLVTAERGRILALARSNLAVLRADVRGPSAHAWLEMWQALLDGPLRELINGMLATDPVAVDLRQVSPFAGVLTQRERVAAIRQATL